MGAALKQRRLDGDGYDGKAGEQNEEESFGHLETGTGRCRTVNPFFFAFVKLAVKAHGGNLGLVVWMIDEPVLLVHHPF